MAGHGAAAIGWDLTVLYRGYGKRGPATAAGWIVQRRCPSVSMILAGMWGGIGCPYRGECAGER